ncbi:hypothetical protein JW721_03905 [Candidatus Micrarchaeota archaeon]|nr:hypothetical protein [Candidatus Micrarchaeota archaeon]
MELHTDLLEKAGDRSWEEIALIARDIEIHIEHDDEEAKQLEKKMRTIKQVLYESMANPERMKHLSPKFYVRLTKILEEMEDKLKLYRAEKHEFVFFLKMLIAKLRKEKLIVTHKFDRKVEFGKHKGGPESGKKGEMQ